MIKKKIIKKTKKLVKSRRKTQRGGSRRYQRPQVSQRRIPQSQPRKEVYFPSKEIPLKEIPIRFSSNMVSKREKSAEKASAALSKFMLKHKNTNFTESPSKLKELNRLSAQVNTKDKIFTNAHTEFLNKFGKLHQSQSGYVAPIKTTEQSAFKNKVEEQFSRNLIGHLLSKNPGKQTLSQQAQSQDYFEVGADPE